MGSQAVFFFTLGGVLAFYAATNLTAGDARFDVDKIGERSKITADYLYGVSQKEEGSAYKLGELDGTIGGMFKLAPQAIVVTLFRPFPWEAHNPVMLLSAMEAMFFLFFTLRILYTNGVIRTLRLVASSSILGMCFIFSFVFAVAVGTSTSNFGTLVRYKIPLIPFYVCGLLITQSMIQTHRRKTNKSSIHPALG